MSTKKLVVSVLFFAGLGILFSSLYVWTVRRNVDLTPQPDASPSHRASQQSPYRLVLGIDRRQWDSMDLQQQRALLTELVEDAEALPQGSPQRSRKIPALYYWMATVLSRLGQGQEALEYLSRGGVEEGSEDWFYLVRGAAHEATGQKEQALEDYLRSFSYSMIPVLWDKMKDFGVSDQELLARLRAQLKARARPFTSFQLQNTQGEIRSLEDYRQPLLLVNFFFPG